MAAQPDPPCGARPSSHEGSGDRRATPCDKHQEGTITRAERGSTEVVESKNQQWSVVISKADTEQNP